MSKDIWYSKYETPKQESRVVWKSGNVVYGGRFDTYYKCFCGPASQFVDLKSVSCWAYIDDFLALETELERTRKALDLATSAIVAAEATLIGCQEADDKYISDTTASAGLKSLSAVLHKIRFLQKDVK